MMKYPGHPNTAIIDLDALVFNHRQVQKYLKGRSQVIAVVKANAYGHGAVSVTRALEAVGAQFFAVAFIDEGIELRQAGVRRPILVMGGFVQDQVPALFDYHLTPVLFHHDHLDWLAATMKGGHSELKVHVKVDTGMGRLGLLPQEVLPFVKRLSEIPHLFLEGLMSHFADEDLKNTQVAKDQVHLYGKVYDELKGEGVAVSCLHMANSAAMLGFEEGWWNWVRPGITLYGYTPSRSLTGILPFKPVMTLKSRITHLRKVPAGTTISYGRTFTARRESLIAVLPIGYADGYPRTLSNRGSVLVGGQRVRIVGRVCMDMVMLDVTNVRDVYMGQEVVLIGSQGKEMVSAMELAEETGTIPHEILSSIGSRIPRIYEGGGSSEARS
jgi:alanine racemase